MNYNAIRRVTNLSSPAALRVETIAGTGNWWDLTNGFANATGFSMPWGCAFDRKRNVLYVADVISTDLRRINLTDMFVTRLVGNVNPAYDPSTWDGLYADAGTSIQLSFLNAMKIDPTFTTLYLGEGFCGGHLHVQPGLGPD